MSRYIVTEEVEYEVEAEDEDAAVELVIDAEDRDKWCVGVGDRYAVEATGESRLASSYQE